MKITDKATIELDNTLIATILQKQELIKKLALKFARKNGYNSVTSIVVYIFDKSIRINPAQNLTHSLHPP